jgi:hypothetical protein
MAPIAQDVGWLTDSRRTPLASVVGLPDAGIRATRMNDVLQDAWIRLNRSTFRVVIGRLARRGVSGLQESGNHLRRVLELTVHTPSHGVSVRSRPASTCSPSPPLRCPSERCSNLVSNEPKPGARLGSPVASRRHCHRQTVRECLAQHEPLSSGSMFLASFRVGTKIVSCGMAFAVVTVLPLRLAVKPTCACQLRSWSRHRRYPPTHWIRRSCRLPRSRPTIDLRTVLDQRPAAGWL